MLHRNGSISVNWWCKLYAVGVYLICGVGRVRGGGRGRSGNIRYRSSSGKIVPHDHSIKLRRFSTIKYRANLQPSFVCGVGCEEIKYGVQGIHRIGYSTKHYTCDVTVAPYIKVHRQPFKTHFAASLTEMLTELALLAALLTVSTAARLQADDAMVCISF